MLYLLKFLHEETKAAMLLKDISDEQIIKTATKTSHSTVLWEEIRF